MNDDILQKQVLSSTIEFRVSDTVQEFKMFKGESAVGPTAAMWAVAEYS